MPLYLYVALAVIAGFVLAWTIRTITILKINKSLKSVQGFLESERLIKERLQKENLQLHELREITLTEHELRISELKRQIRIMDEDILLLQKSNEETEAMLYATQPIAHSLKLKLIEANNAIARFKSTVKTS